MFTSTLLHLPGAVEAAGKGVATHYGHPLAESRALEEGRAIVDLSHEGVLKLEGPDRLSWLNSITSQHLEGLPAGASTETLILSPQGRIEFAFGVAHDGEALWLFVDRDALPALQDFLLKMRFMLRVDITDETPNYAQILTFSDEIHSLIAERVGVAVTWSDPWGEVLPGGHQYAAAESYTWGAKRMLIASESLPAIYKLVRENEFSVAGLSALEALEVRAWRPSVAEIDERTIPHELDWMRTAVHLSKGCYRGQETIAKVHNLGHPPRRLVMLHLDGADAEMPAPGALIWLADDPDQKPLGRITRAAMHHDWGSIALALLKRRAPVTGTLAVALPSGGHCLAEQEIIVPPEAGATLNVPRLPRLQ